MTNKRKGNYGESLACAELSSKGYRILERNYQKVIGEIDIVALEGMTLVFIEVKTRKDDKYGQGAEAVTNSKQQKIIKTAMHYILEKGFEGLQCRFDVIEITLMPFPAIRHIENAFE
ncbi:MAG: YraN family protein [Tissierellia bacterium]|nr:YraN family protein [Tissierellia bacterium]